MLALHTEKEGERACTIEPTNVNCGTRGFGPFPFYQSGGRDMPSTLDGVDVCPQFPPRLSSAKAYTVHRTLEKKKTRGEDKQDEEKS